MARYALTVVAAVAAVAAALAAPSATMITIAAQPRIVTYGSSTTLSGTVGCYAPGISNTIRS